MEGVEGREIVVVEEVETCWVDIEVGKVYPKRDENCQSSGVWGSGEGCRGVSVSEDEGLGPTSENGEAPCSVKRKTRQYREKRENATGRRETDVLDPCYGKAIVSVLEVRQGGEGERRERRA